MADDEQSPPKEYPDLVPSGLGGMPEKPKPVEEASRSDYAAMALGILERIENWEAVNGRRFNTCILQGVAEALLARHTRR